MSNGHVLSGSEWGNILVWEEGLIKFEVCRKNRSTCHVNGITQIGFNDGDVMTVGMDGYVRIWFWETVTNADPPDTDPFVPIEPTYEVFDVHDYGSLIPPCQTNQPHFLFIVSYW